MASKTNKKAEQKASYASSTTSKPEDLASLMTLNFQQFENVSLMAA